MCCCNWWSFGNVSFLFSFGWLNNIIWSSFLDFVFRFVISCSVLIFFVGNVCVLLIMSIVFCWDWWIVISCFCICWVNFCWLYLVDSFIFNLLVIVLWSFVGESSGLGMYVVIKCFGNLFSNFW